MGEMPEKEKKYEKHTSQNHSGTDDGACGNDPICRFARCRRRSANGGGNGHLGKRKKTGVITSYICPLMYMNNPLCAKMPVITSSNKLRTYSTSRYYKDADILDIITGK